MPFVDLNSKKIYGCEEGSKSWWHETGHIIFDNSEFGTRIKYYNYFFTMIVVVLISLTFFTTSFWLRLFILFSSLGVITTYLMKEIWCEIYARTKTRHK